MKHPLSRGQVRRAVVRVMPQALPRQCPGQRVRSVITHLQNGHFDSNGPVRCAISAGSALTGARLVHIMLDLELIEFG